jgi:DNA repair exonuclease SbcCD ATPase subunit
MEWLKKLLELDDEQLEKVKQEFPKHAVPKEQYNKKAEKVDELQSELDTAKTQLDAMNEKVDNLEVKAENADELKEKLNEIQSEYSDYKEQEEARIKNIKTKNALEKNLLADNVPEDLVDLVANDFDIDNLELSEDGKLMNYESQREKAKEKRPSAFAKEKITGNKPQDGDEGKIVDNPFASDTFNLKKQGELVKEKPETAKKLIKAAGKNPATYGL